MAERKNRDHTGGGEQNRRDPKGGKPAVEKNPPRDSSGRTASQQPNARGFEPETGKPERSRRER
jgi:hypothetical protein